MCFICMKGNRFSWHLAIGYMWLAVCVLLLFGAFPWAAYTLHTRHASSHSQAVFAAFIFVMMAIPLTIWDVVMHFTHWNNPTLQRYIIRILWMIPVYALNAWCSLSWPSSSIYLDTVRECYEAYVIFNFYAFMLSYLHERPDFDAQLLKRPDQRHIMPFCCFTPWKMGPEFMRKASYGVTCYVIIRPLTTIIVLILSAAGHYTPGAFKINQPYPYIAIVNTLAQGWAMYCLIIFYQAFKKDMAKTKPLAKLLTIKFVVFFSFWQSVLISAFQFFKIIKENPALWGNYSADQVSNAIQDFCICIEMFIAALAHHYLFSYKEFLPETYSRNRLGVIASIKNVFTIEDVSVHVLHSIKSMGARSDSALLAHDTLAIRMKQTTTTQPTTTTTTTTTTTEEVWEKPVADDHEL